MRILKIKRPGKEGVNLGFRRQDQHVLDTEYESNSPKVLVVRTPLLEEEDQLCSLCGSRMMPIEGGHKLLCTYFQCANVVDVLNNTPLKKISQDMQPYQSQHYNPNNGEPVPVFISYNPDSGNTTVNKSYEITYSSPDKKVQRIRCRGYPKDISFNAFD